MANRLWRLHGPLRGKLHLQGMVEEWEAMDGYSDAYVDGRVTEAVSDRLAHYDRMIELMRAGLPVDE